MMVAKKGKYELHNNPVTMLGVKQDSLSLFDTEKRIYTPFTGKIKSRTEAINSYRRDFTEPYTQKDYQEMLDEQIHIYELQKRKN